MNVVERLCICISLSIFLSVCLDVKEPQRMVTQCLLFRGTSLCPTVVAPFDPSISKLEEFQFPYILANIYFPLSPPLVTAVPMGNLVSYCGLNLYFLNYSIKNIPVICMNSSEESLVCPPVPFKTTLPLPLSNQRCHKQRQCLWPPCRETNKVTVLVMGI